MTQTVLLRQTHYYTRMDDPPPNELPPGLVAILPADYNPDTDVVIVYNARDSEDDWSGSELNLDPFMPSGPPMDGRFFYQILSLLRPDDDAVEYQLRMFLRDIGAHNWARLATRDLSHSEFCLDFGNLPLLRHPPRRRTTLLTLIRYSQFGRLEDNLTLAVMQRRLAEVDRALQAAANDNNHPEPLEETEPDQAVARMPIPDDDSDDQSVRIEVPVEKKKRGRPRKYPAKESPNVPTKKKPGRPKKDSR